MLGRVLLFCLAIPLVSACSDDGGNGGNGGSAGASAPCGGRGETYSAGMKKPGSAGKLTFTLLDAQPAPPGVLDNVWSVAIADSAGAPTEGATLTVKTWMPDHEHGSPTQAVITDAGGGKYMLDPVNLPMPGLWEITIGAKPTQGDADSAMFAFCVGE